MNRVPALLRTSFEVTDEYGVPIAVYAARRLAAGASPQVQREILGRALEALAPGGLLVYSTCSLEREENEEVVGGSVVRSMRRLPGRAQVGDDDGLSVWTFSLYRVARSLAQHA